MIKIRTFEFIGVKSIEIASSVGKFTKLVTETSYWILRGRINIRNTIIQMVKVGWDSMPVISLTSFFTGMVLALQAGSATRNVFNEPVYVGTLVGFSLVKELGPVMTGIVLAGRVGASIAAELGTMKVTEQLDALRTLGTNPVKYLAVPRFLAFITMMPLLCVLSNVVGIAGGMMVGSTVLNVPTTVFWEDIVTFMDSGDFFQGFIKSVVFAAIIACISCYKGFECKGGAEGVGRATTDAVMVSMILILVSDYFLTATLRGIGIGG
jgi:phospholipid/cholesterol/gamma-HCH transport system permease protein